MSNFLLGVAVGAAGAPLIVWAVKEIIDILERKTRHLR